VNVRMEHIRKAKMCSAGARQFVKRQGWDWAEFLRNGIPVEKLEETGDTMALEVARIARER
jgi:hypothetical protein